VIRGAVFGLRIDAPAAMQCGVAERFRVDGRALGFQEGDRGGHGATQRNADVTDGDDGTILDGADPAHDLVERPERDGEYAHGVVTAVVGRVGGRGYIRHRRFGRSRDEKEER
jgi:hypothetical protein